MAEDKNSILADGAIWNPERACGALHLGIDVGSTTVKLAVLNDANDIVYAKYQRHHTDVRACARDLFEGAAKLMPESKMTCAITGSGGLLLSQWLGLEFVQEVIASKRAVETLIPQTDVAIELGGEDAKIIYFDSGIEQRMNGTCAGGTGAFIDQMATLLHTDASGLNELAASATTIYPIASRCGVFAKTDVQPLLNEGARPEDVAASIFQAVVTQTISGLACGRPIRGHVAFLGGPLQYLSELRRRFYLTLDLDEEHRIVPDNAHLFVASGAAMAHESDKLSCFPELIAAIDALGDTQGSEVARLEPLFASEEDYAAFKERHDAEVVPRGDLSSYAGDRVFIGLDAGSTTMKAAMVGEDGQLLHTWYGSNNGDILGTAKTIMADFYEHIPSGCAIGHVTTTGYGEALLIEALKADSGEIETVAHLRGARAFLPGVEFILDIGGQDMKCLRVRDGVIEHIMLNEACSSGCGSFIESFAVSMDMDVRAFAAAAIRAKAPVDLGSRCTVFMNSSVKQAQKDGASIENISAGLAISVVKNALYKVIRASGPEELGRKIVVQGGTFYNEAVLRAFEMEMGVEVIRPDIAGLMGAFGAALYGKAKGKSQSSLLTLEELEGFTQKVRSVNCGLCGNNCQLTVNIFPGGKKYISGNRCDRPVSHRGAENPLNLYEYKQRLLAEYKPQPGIRGTIGIPLGLGMYELLPFWYAFFTKLGFSVVTSGPSSRELYLEGQSTIPSDTVCYPAKLLHGHIHRLSRMAVNAVFYPCLTYNVDEGLGDNHYNCPVVAYYPEVIAANCHELENIRFIYDYIGIHRRRDFPRKMTAILAKYFAGISLGEVKGAADAAYAEYAEHMSRVRVRGGEIIAQARAEGRQIIVLAGRPYHADEEINHGIDKLICSYGAAVITEDSISHLVEKFPTSILNQWTYHSRLYAAAKYIADQPDMNLVQLVSFGCGVDAITTDETREILQREGKLYTQIKIDEIANLGAVNIRLRSLFAAIEPASGETPDAE